jgi:hypothetical protein
MKKLLFAIILFTTTQTFAGLDKGVREATLRANKSFDLSNLDQVGSTIKNEKTGEVLRHHCLKRDQTQECAEIIHILSSDNKDLILHDRENKVINQNVDFIKYRLNMEFRDSVLNFTDFDPNYRRSAGDFTGHISLICIYEPKECALLLLLPLTIAADLIMLPIDVTINETQRHVTRRKAKHFIENLKSDEELVELQNREFLSLLKGLSQF